VIALGEEELLENLVHLVGKQGLAKTLEVDLVLAILRVELLLVVLPSVHVEILKVLEELLVLPIVDLLR